MKNLVIIISSSKFGWFDMTNDLFVGNNVKLVKYVNENHFKVKNDATFLDAHKFWYHSENQKNFGVFLYTEEMEEPEFESFSEKNDAILFAQKLQKYIKPNQYIEVWKKDEYGMYGVDGNPEYKSDL